VGSSRGRRNRRQRTARERRGARCIFCGAKPPLTDEHLFGDWLRKLGHTGEGVHEFIPGDGSEPLIQRGRGIFTKKLKIVCGTCNHEWMSRIEEAAKTLLVQMFNLPSESEIVLNTSDQLALARWAFKTMVIARYAADDSTFPAGHRNFPAALRQEFHRTNNPPQHAQIWIGAASVPDTPTYGEMLVELQYKPIDLTALNPDGSTTITTAYQSELRLFNVVFVVMGYAADSALVRIDPGGNLGQVLTPLWPPNQNDIVWPPPQSVDTLGGMSALKQLPVYPRESIDGNP
jgi:hypothetical protein